MTNHVMNIYQAYIYIFFYYVCHFPTTCFFVGRVPSSGRDDNFLMDVFPSEYIPQKNSLESFFVVVEGYFNYLCFFQTKSIIYFNMFKYVEGRSHTIIKTLFFIAIIIYIAEFILFAT